MFRNEEKFRAAFNALKTHAKDPELGDIRSLFKNDPQRFEHFSLRLDDLLFDFSKCGVTAKTLELLDNLADAAGLKERREAMFNGEAINLTENRAVLHVALRAPEGSTIMLGDKNVVEDVQSVLSHMEKFCEGVRSGALKGEHGGKITDVVNIGIGGSDLGPKMATLALKPYHDGPNCHFVSNVDGADIADTLSRLDPATTLIIISSKTFTTAETMTNARVARQWIAEKLGEMAVSKHFAAVSTALGKVADFGIDPSRVFGFWNWVGGRYSVWSAIGLSVMMAIGPENFRKFLSGGHAMDEHFRTAPYSRNLAVRLGLIGFYNRVICGYPTRAVIPYEERLSRLPAYLQQLDMESNGKHVTIDGKPVTMPTGPVVWGEPGTNGQHAFFQLLHQGTDIIPVEFIVAVNGHEQNLRHQHNMLLANCFAQSEALMRGRSQEAAKAMLMKGGMSEAEAEKLAPHKSFVGNRPTLTLVHDKLSPFTLGRLIALYEHRVFVEGTLMNINSFDQWGVELGKELANELLPMVSGQESTDGHDSSTSGLISYVNQRRAH
ncbi:glucose-6-phosphate isomerase [Bartonella sp. M0177]|uniref:glucose-6-phosphate isomerase n=1 Tax=Bartonella sp. M0177 TaxID=2750940 RepID=UPI0018DCE326|nr:glucose-6-phosphate isomerase [Bartonella sp. M0177]MBI0003991.1 glucose-6-phosphate isomerase [Bartonella sp. M0177]